MDDMIDKALATYAAPEIPAGLEERIMRRALAPRPRVTPWWIAIAAAAAVAALLFVAVFGRNQRGVSPSLEAAAIPLPASPVARQPLAPPVSIAAERRVRKAGPATVWPKLHVFPSLAPIPASEIALVRLASADPEIAKSLLAEPETGEPRPIIIEPISIKPLEDN